MALSSIVGLRSLSICSKASFIAYHQCITFNNDLPDCEIQEPIDSSHLLYTDYTKEDESVSLVTGSNLGKEGQHVYNENLALKKASKPHSKDKKRNGSSINFELSENIFNI